MPLLFVRPGELRKAEWVDIDLEAAEWRYTVGKTGTPYIVPLARQSVGILRERRVMMQAWADYLDRLRAGTIELRPARVSYLETRDELTPS